MQVLTPENDFYTIIKIDEETIVNVYKPPSMEFGTEVLPIFEKPFFVGGDFNSHNPLWGYNDTNRDGLNVADWMIREDLTLLYNSTDPGTFRSARWNRSYTPDLCFVSKNIDGSAQPATRRILRGFPNSQHRPIVVEIGLKVPFVRADKKNRWNFNKADWTKFAQIIDQTVTRIPARAFSYDRFVGLIKHAANKSIPRGHRESITPGWSDDCKELFDEFQVSGNIDIGKQLLQKLDDNRKVEWESKMSTVDFAKSSKKAWSLINRMTGKSSNSKHVYPITPDQIATQMVQNSKGSVSTAQKRKVNSEFKKNFRSSPLSSIFAAPFTSEEINASLTEIKSGKAPGNDNLFPDFLKHLGVNAVKWLSKLFTNIYSTGQLPRAWKNVKVIAFPKPNKPLNEPASYRPISLLSCGFKLFEKTILARFGETINNTIPKDQAGFQSNRSCCDQVLALTNFIELGFEKGLKTGVVFLDLTAAYDTVWKKGLLMKLSRIIKCKKTLILLTNILSDRCLRVEMNEEISRKRILNDGLPQGSVLSCVLYCLYTSDLPNTQSRKFIYADDIAMAAQAKAFEDVEKILRTDLCKMSFYFAKWRLKPNASKTVSITFHLNNRQANRKLKLKLNGKKIKHDKFPKYLGVILDRSLTYKPHLESARKKLKSRVNIVQKLTGTTWGCSAKTLRITTQSLVMSVADYCSPVWMNSCHTKLVDTQINVALRLVCGAVQPTEIEWLSVLSNIAPAKILREESALRECRRVQSDIELPIYNDLVSAPINRRLRSRSPFWEYFRNAHNQMDLKSRWKKWWDAASVHNKNLINDPTAEVDGYNLPRRTWLRLNRLRTGQGCCAFLLHRWNIIESPLCQCGAIQTMKHLVEECTIHRFQGTIEDLHAVTSDAVNWLNNLNVDI